MGNATDISAGYDGYTTVIPKSAGTIAQILKQSGYSTAMFGKGHLTPRWEQGPTGPFDRWPTGLGLEYFYGFIGADTSMFEPMLFEHTSAVDRPTGRQNYHFDRDLADRAVRWIETQHQTAPDKPFFIYYATGTAHAPNMVSKEWIARFKGKFDQGWDAVREQTFARQKAGGVIPVDALLTGRPALLPAWDSLSADQKRLSARFMETYAASLAFADHQIGRVIDSLRTTGELDNTLVIFIQGDNGGSAEGGINGMLFEQSQINGFQENLNYQLTRLDDIGSERVYAVYPAGWGWAMNTPFQYYKRVASHLGGIRNGLVISWPSHIKDAGAMRPQFHHISDITPTILEAAQVQALATLDGVPQKPLDGISMTYTFKSRDAHSRRTTQVFEVMNNYAIYSDGWMASTRPTVIPWDLGKSPSQAWMSAPGSSTTSTATSASLATSQRLIPGSCIKCSSCSGPRRPETASCRFTIFAMDVKAPRIPPPADRFSDTHSASHSCPGILLHRLRIALSPSQRMSSSLRVAPAAYWRPTVAGLAATRSICAADAWSFSTTHWTRRTHASNPVTRCLRALANSSPIFKGRAAEPQR